MLPALSGTDPRPHGISLSLRSRPVPPRMTAPSAAAEDRRMNQVQQLSTAVRAESHSMPAQSSPGSLAERTTMQAIVQDKYGSSSVLQLGSIAKPEIGVDDVLIRVRAAGLHIGDVHVMRGQPYLMRILGFGLRAPKARIRGMDVAGTVEEVGSNVTQFQPGDDVYGTCNGAFAEYATARADTLAAKPSNLTFEQAAAVP